MEEDAGGQSFDLTSSWLQTSGWWTPREGEVELCRDIVARVVYPIPAREADPRARYVTMAKFFYDAMDAVNAMPPNALPMAPNGALLNDSLSVFLADATVTANEIVRNGSIAQMRDEWAREFADELQPGVVAFRRAIGTVGGADESFWTPEPLGKKTRKPVGKKARKSVGKPESPRGVTGNSVAGPVPVLKDLPELVERFPLRSGSYDTLLPPMTGELVRAQRAGTFLATDIVRGYADRLYSAVRATVGGDVPQAPRHGLVVRDGCVTSADDPTQPAVMLRKEGFGTRVMLARLDERGIHPNLHLTAAARVLSGARSVEETGARADLPDLLDQTWFLLAFWLSTSLGNGRMLDGERRLIVHLVGCCSRLHFLSEAAGLPPFVTDAIDSDLVVRHFDEQWVTTAHVRMPDGEVQQEGHFSTSDSGRPLRLGALLRAQVQRDASPTDPAAEYVLGLLKAEADDLAGARAAFESARAHPDWSTRATRSLRDLRPEEASLELLTIFTEWGIKTRRSRPPDPGSAARARIVEIGESLHEAGGTSLMRQAHEAFGRRTDRTESNWLAIIWSEVGDWHN